MTPLLLLLQARSVGLASLLTAGALACASPPPPATVVTFGRVWTGNPDQPWAGGVAMRGDTIVGVGDSADVAKFVGEQTVVTGAPGGMVVPGFMDGHTHFLDGGIQLVSVDLRTADSPEEFTARIAAFAAERKPGEWIIGGDWDHERWPGTPLPTREWIDSVTPNNPVFVNRLDGHMGVANSAALRAAGITRATKDIPGGVIVRDPRTGEPTGILKDNAMGPVYRVMPPPSEAQLDAALARALSFAASKGVTATNYMSAPPAWLGAFQRARAAGTLTVRTKMFFPIQAWRWVADTVARIGPGDDWLRIDGVKGYMDGSLGSTTALLFRPYRDAPNTRGLETTPLDSIRRWVQSADSVHLQVAVHAIGDRANALLLDTFDSVMVANGPRDRRFRIEHAQHLRPEDIVRIAKMNVIPSMQPYHIIDDGRWAAKRIDTLLLQTTYAFRTLIDDGAHLEFGSDWTVAPLDPLLGVYAAVTRRTLDDKNPGGWFPAQKITVEEALRAYTAENAYGVFAEGRRGVLKPGARADLVLLDRDITAIDPVDIPKTQVLVTVAGGRVVYRAP
ncbi:MAG TPA: amidohydrolase [Gemmatimonadales bacterium]|nr:amidohydrolase [Gemmatimonadales bacterium]